LPLLDPAGNNPASCREKNTPTPEISVLNKKGKVMRVLKWGLSILLGLIIVVFLGVYGYLRATLPDYDGQITIPNLKDNVEFCSGLLYGPGPTFSYGCGKACRAGQAF
jgi:hypothetical protein